MTVTSTDPADTAGVTAVIDVGEFTTNDVASWLPNQTLVILVKFVPLIVTLVPPAVVPLLMASPVTVGTETGVV